jgi:hypothetical protein
MSEQDPGAPGFPWGATLVTLVVLSMLGAAIGVPFYLKSARESRERHAVGSLQVVATCETDFRANDRDWNKLNDFWTGDVSGLYYVASAKDGREIHLLFLPQAHADRRSLFQQEALPDRGFFLQAMDQDNNFKSDPEGIYRVDTDGSGRKVHNRSRFGFCAFPEDPGAGRYTYIVNENYTIFRFPNDTLMTYWPDDQELKNRCLGHE